MGGAINKVAPDATAFVHRNAFGLVSVGVGWQGDERVRNVDALQVWVDGLWSGLGPSTSDASYQNFADPALRRWSRFYFGDNLGRLEQIKRAVDPSDAFRFPQSIHPA